MATQDPSGQCFVQTSSLDGEKNLKPKIAIKLIQERISKGVDGEGISIEVRCPLPEKNLYAFKGLMAYESGKEVLNFDLEFKQFIHCVSILI